MSKNVDKKHLTNETKPVENDQRRDFLKAVTFAAAGFVITPIISGCGSDEPPVKKPGKSGSGGGAKPKPTGDGDKKPAATGKGPQLVDTADAVGERGSVKFSAITKNAADPVYLQIPPGATNEAEAKAVNGGKGPINDAMVVIAGSGGVNYVADVLFSLELAPGTKALRHTGDATGVNWDFRFTRMMHVGQKKSVTYMIGDSVPHNIAVKNPAGNDIGDQKNGQAEAPGKPSKHTFAAANAFVRAGSYEVSCSMHNWERGYIWVSDHAYVGVTGNPNDNHGEGHDYRQSKEAAGTVTIKDIPVGKHKVNVIKEGVVKGSFEVEVKANEETVATPYEVA